MVSLFHRETIYGDHTKGVPVWLKGKVYRAFEANVFWPSPPKTKSKRNVSAQVEKELFPACASTAKWRELHRQRKEKQSKKQKQQPSKQMDECLYNLCKCVFIWPQKECRV